MRVVMLDAPRSLIEQRARLGQDRWDEVWEGVLHMVPPPSYEHQRLGTLLLVFLEPIARGRGLLASYETGVFRPEAGEADFRVPDLVVARPQQVTARGVEGGAEMVVEIRSPNDESVEKLPFYQALGVQEVLLIEPGERTVELYVLRGGRYHAALPDAQGVVRSPALGVTFATAPGPQLVLGGPEGTVQV